MRCRLRWIGPALAFAAMATRSPATVIAPLTLEEIVRAADRILLATVAETRCAPSLRGRSIDTIVILDVVRSLKGPALSTSTYAFRQRGGRIGEREVLFPGSPELRAGGRYLLFLHEDGRIFSPIVGLRLGCFRIGEGRVRDDAGHPVVGIRAGRPVVRADPDPAEAPISSDAFIAHIEAIIASQALHARGPESGGEVPR